MNSPKANSRNCMSGKQVAIIVREIRNMWSGLSCRGRRRIVLQTKSVRNFHKIFRFIWMKKSFNCLSFSLDTKKYKGEGYAISDVIISGIGRCRATGSKIPKKNERHLCTALERLSELSRQIDKSEVVSGLFMDVTKAFYCVNNSVLLKKLERAGIICVISHYHYSILKYVESAQYAILSI